MAAIQTMQTRFADAMDTDFNTAQAMGTIFSLITQVNKSLTDPTNVSIETLKKAYNVIRETSQVLGIYSMDEKNVEDTFTYLKPLLELLLEIRQDARNKKDWDTSDRIRDRLKQMNIEIQDSHDGSTWKFL